MDPLRRSAALRKAGSFEPGPLRAAVLFGVVGLACASFAVSGSAGKGWTILVPAAGIAAFLVAWPAWKLLVARSGGGGRGLLAGALVGLLSQPVAWYLAALHSYVWGGPSSLGDEPLGPFGALRASLVLSLGSLLATGWLTVPAGALAGLALGRDRTRRRAGGSEGVRS
jgi:hypothetical protein